MQHQPRPGLGSLQVERLSTSRAGGAGVHEHIRREDTALQVQEAEGVPAAPVMPVLGLSTAFSKWKTAAVLYSRKVTALATAGAVGGQTGRFAVIGAAVEAFHPHPLGDDRGRIDPTVVGEAVLLEKQLESFALGMSGSSDQPCICHRPSGSMPVRGRAGHSWRRLDSIQYILYKNNLMIWREAPWGSSISPLVRINL